jgi:lysophospholipase L1-like esterase
MYGTNDGWVDPGKSESRLSEQTYETNLRLIVIRLQQAGIRVLLMTPPRFGEDNPRNGLGEDPNLRLARYVDRCRTVARDLAVPLVDHYGHWESAQAAGRRLQAWTTDGCHPNADGHAALTEQIMRVLPAVAATLQR